MPRLRISRILAFGLLFVSASGYAAEWQIQVVDPGGGGKYLALRMDSFGNAHISYLNEQTHELKYVFWDHRLNRWFTMKLDNRCNGFTSLALDSQQHPHISYLEYGTGRLKYAHFDGTAWKTEAVPLAVKLIEYYTSIALDSKDLPAMSYYEILNQTSPDYVLHLRTVRFNGKYWELSTVDGAAGSGKFNALAMGHDGNLQVAYANVRDETASLRYARWNGTSWNSQTLQGSERPQPMYSVNMVLGKDDVPHVTYTDAVNRLIKYATIREGKWQFETVDAIAEGAFPDRNGIALDDHGNPYVSYFDSGAGSLIVARREGNKWTAEIVDNSFAGFTPSIQIANDEIVVMYYDTITNSLKCARRPLQLKSAVQPEGAEGK
jgi:hypothetical protein